MRDSIERICEIHREDRFYLSEFKCFLNWNFLELDNVMAK